ncbi:MAG: pitrilysin family protein [bacterium]|mgnify:CR=1 FL=1|nr:pitrilysin family protein [bacterium]
MSYSSSINAQTLSNGIEAYCLPKQEIPLVCLLIYFGIGSGSEQSNETGMCHFLEHMMFKGSSNFPQGSLDIFSMRHGGENNAFTSRDSTCYYHVLPSESWWKVLGLEKDRLNCLSLESKEFESEKQVVLEELYMYQDDPFEALYDAHYLSAFESSHPYHHPILGFETVLQAMTVDSMRKFYENRYQAGNMKFLVLGKVEPDQVFEQLEQSFGSFRSEPKFKYSQTSSQIKPSNTLIEIPQDVNQTRLRLSLPSNRSSDPTEEPVAALLEELIAGGRSCPLMHSLRDELGLVTSLQAFNDDQVLDGRFFIDLELSERVQPEQVLPFVFEELARIREGEISSEELDAAKRRSNLCFYQDQERLEDRAYCLSQHLLEADFESYFEFGNRVNAVQADQISSFAKKYFDAANMIIGVSYDQSGNAPKLMEANF